MIFTTEIFLFTIRGSLWIGIYLMIMGIGAWLFISFLEYIRKKKYFLDITEKMEQLDKKYYIVANGHCNLYTLKCDVQRSF